jgi:hypothetical protein
LSGKKWLSPQCVSFSLACPERNGSIQNACPFRSGGAHDAKRNLADYSEVHIPWRANDDVDAGRVLAAQVIVTRYPPELFS